MDNVRVPYLEPGIYRHYKGKRYEVLSVGLHTEDLTPMVVYKPLYEANVQVWIRPYNMFIETVVVQGREVSRFEKIK